MRARRHHRLCHARAPAPVVWALTVGACTTPAATSDVAPDDLVTDSDVGDAAMDSAIDARSDARWDGLDARSTDARGHDSAVDVPQVSDVGGPMLLSASGLYEDFATRRLAPGIVRYVPRFELWADGAAKDRYLLLPAGTRIDTRDMDQWVFPVGTRIWKEFRVDGRLVETRLLQKVRDGLDGWWAVAYVWNATGTEAIAEPLGAEGVGGTMYDVPSQEHCVQCHASGRDFVIGVSAVQLSGPDATAPLADFVTRGMLSDPPARMPVIPGDATVQAALGYLHGNCGHCHNDRSYVAGAVALRLRLSANDTTPAATDTYRTSIGAVAFHMIGPSTTIVVPGSPDTSQLYVRMSLRDFDAMPPIASRAVDPAGLAAVRLWINTLP